MALKQLYNSPKDKASFLQPEPNQADWQDQLRQTWKQVPRGAVYE